MVLSFRRRNSVALKTARPKNWARTVLACESLEHRLAPATIAWDGGPSGTGTDWHTATNWAGDSLPGATDQADIGVAFSGVTITSAANVSVDGLSSAATLQINGGNFSVDSASSSNKLTLTGGALGGAGDFTISSVFLWTGGDLAAGAGTTILPASASGTISGASDKWLSRTLENSGSIDYTGSNLRFGFAGGQAGVLDNLTGAVFNANGNGDMLVLNAGSHAVNNSGTFNRSGTGGTSIDVPFNNSGSVNLTAGILSLDAGGSQSGSFMVISGGAILRVGGTHVFSGGSSVGGAGRAEISSGITTVNGAISVSTVRLQAGTLNVNSSPTVANLEVNDGSLGGSGVLTVTTALTWTGGNMAAGAGKTVLSGTATGAISGASNKWLSRTLENSGDLTYSGGGLLFGFGSGQAGVLHNLVGGDFNITGGVNLAQDQSGSHAVNNDGVINRSGPGTTVVSIPMNNNGTVNILGGTLDLALGGTDNGAYSLNPGTVLLLTSGRNLAASSSLSGAGTVQFVGGASTVAGTVSGPAFEISTPVDINSNVSISSLTLMAGGALGGTGVVSVTGTLTWTGGDMVSSTGKTVLTSSGTGSIPGAGSKSLSRTLEVGGILTYSGINLQFGVGVAQSGVLSILSGGEFDVTGDGDLTELNPGTHSVLNAGIFRKSGGTDSTILGVPFTNTGLLDILAVNVTAAAPFTFGGTVSGTGGQLTITAGGDAVGAYAIAAGTVTIPSGTFTLQNGAVGSGAGILILSGGTLQVETGESASVAKLTHRRGTLTGAGTLTVTNTFTWAAAPAVGGGTTIIAAGATGTLSGTGNKFLGRTLENQGTLNYTGTGLQFGFGGQNGILTNAASGILNFTGDGDLSLFNAGSHAFNNLGTVNRSGTGVTSIAIPASNSGTVNVDAGIYSMDVGGSHSGTFSVDASATLRLNGGTHLLTPASSTSGGGTLHVAAGTATVDGTLSISFLQINSTVDINSNATVGTLAFISSSLGGTGIVTVNSSFAWSGGDMAAGTGKTVVAGTATGTISGASNKWLSRTLENSGNLSYTGSNLFFGFALGQAGVLSNLSGGIFNSVNDGDLLVWFGGSHAVNNAGSFNRSGTGTTDIDVPYNNSGSTNVTAQTLGLDAGGTHTGSFAVSSSSTLRMGGGHALGGAASVTGAGRMDVNSGTTNSGGTFTIDTARVLGGTLNLNSASAISSLELSAGTLGGSGVLTVSSGLTWSAGNMAAGSGKTVLGAAGTGTISGSGNKWLSRTLENNGTLDYTGSNLLFGFAASQAGVLSNLSGGVFNANGGGDFTQAFAGTHSILNAGTFNRFGAGATNVVIPFDNSSAVHVTAGVLSLDMGGTSSGLFTASVGSTLRFGGGTHNLTGSSSLGGGGTAQFSGGTTNVDGGLGIGTVDINAPTNINSSPSFSNLNMTGGSLGGTGTVTVTGTLSWSGGNMAAGTGKTVIASSGSGTITGAGSKWLSRTLENAGTLDYLGANLSFGFGALQAGVLNNLGTGVFTADGGGDFGLTNAGSHAIINSGTMNRTGAGTTSVAFGISFTTSGAVDIQAGTLDVSEDYTQTGGTTILGVGTTLGSAGDVLITSGSLRGFGTIDSNLVNSGQVRPGGAGAAGTIIVTGDYTQNASGSLNIELGGTAAGTFDVLSVGGSVALDGTLNVSLINSFNPAMSDQFMIMTWSTQSGSFATMNGLNIGGGKQLDPDFNTNDLTLNTIPA